MNEISLSTAFEKVKVVVRIKPYRKGERRKYPVEDLKFPEKLYFFLPIRLDFYDMYEADDYINGLITKNVEAISGAVMAAAEKQAIRRPDGVDYIILSISSEYDKKDKEIKEWSAIT